MVWRQGPPIVHVGHQDITGRVHGHAVVDGRPIGSIPLGQLPLHAVGVHKTGPLPVAADFAGPEQIHKSHPSPGTWRSRQGQPVVSAAE